MHNENQPLYMISMRNLRRKSKTRKHNFKYVCWQYSQFYALRNDYPTCNLTNVFGLPRGKQQFSKYIFLNVNFGNFYGNQLRTPRVLKKDGWTPLTISGRLIVPRCPQLVPIEISNICQKFPILN